MLMQGREMGPAELTQIRALIGAEPGWSRYRLSRELCRLWEWRTAKGQLKDMAARTLLLKLEARGLVDLPARRWASPNRMRHKRVVRVDHARERVRARLADLQPLRIVELSESPEELSLFETLLHEHHYLSYTSPVGMNLKYLVRDRQGRPVACALFGSAAWQCADRDAFLGWDRPTRQRNLQLLTNNTRFLIPAWVQVPHLASHVLGLIARRIRADWQAKYGHPVQALETFVDRWRFQGTCYRAANWLRVGRTRGRTRNDRAHRLRAAVKDVYLYPLVADFRRELSA